MAKTFECKDAGAVCRAKIRGETDVEVLKKANEHAKRSHGIDLTQSRTLVRYAQSLIREE